MLWAGRTLSCNVLVVALMRMETWRLRCAPLLLCLGPAAVQAKLPALVLAPRELSALAPFMKCRSKRPGRGMTVMCGASPNHFKPTMNRPAHALTSPHEASWITMVALMLPCPKVCALPSKQQARLSVTTLAGSLKGGKRNVSLPR